MSIFNKQINITGLSGEIYTFKTYPLNFDFNDWGGIYVFVNIDIYRMEYYGIYCGKTENFNQRFANHHKEKEINRYNPNAIAILFEQSKKKRTEIEIDILEGNDFPCNDQHN